MKAEPGRSPDSSFILAFQSYLTCPRAARADMSLSRPARLLQSKLAKPICRETHAPTLKELAFSKAEAGCKPGDLRLGIEGDLSYQCPDSVNQN